MTGKVALPLFKLEVTYLVRHGRRWSALEHLLLWACRTPRTAAYLAEQCAMPTRLISESLLNLLRVGWVEIHITPSATSFSTTEGGAAAAGKPMPDHLLETKVRSVVLYQERLTGELFSLQELTVKHRKQLAAGSVEELEPELHRPLVLGPDLVDRLPLRRDDTFERLRDLPNMLPGDLFAIVEVDDKGFADLPDRTPSSLSLAIARALGEEGKPTQVPKTGRTRAAPTTDAALGLPLAKRGTMHPVAFSADDLIVGGQPTLNAARAVIEAARHVVIIHSTFIGRNIANLLPSLQAAAERNVQVYVNWGRADDPEGIEANPSEVNARLAITRLPAEARNNITLGVGTTGSHAKIILADNGHESEYVALLGSCNWLDSPYHSIEASIRIRDPRLLSSIAAALANLIAPVVNTDPVVSRLLDIHGETATRPQPSSPHRAMLVLDDDHYAAVRDAMNEASSNDRVLLASHKLGHAGDITVFEPMREAAKAGAKVKLIYNKRVPNFGEDLVATKILSLAQQGVTLQRGETEMHAKFLVWKDTLLVTSFNFLSASPARGVRGSEIGILLHGPGVVQGFTTKLAEQGTVIPRQQRGGKRRRRRRGRKQAA